jgi:hypothetical protein
MNNFTQREIVLGQLQSQGFVSRNWCLAHHISRLGAIVCNLKKEGVSLEAKRGERRSDDYKYILIK